MPISAYMNPENTQLGQICWKPELCKTLKNSWMWNTWNYQGHQGTVLFFCTIHNFFQRWLQHCCRYPSLLWAAASSGGSIQLTFQLHLRYPNKMGTAGFILLIIKYFLKNFQAI